MPVLLMARATSATAPAGGWRQGMLKVQVKDPDPGTRIVLLVLPGHCTAPHALAAPLTLGTSTKALVKVNCLVPELTNCTCPLSMTVFMG
jgi:hypothetical protein